MILYWFFELILRFCYHGWQSLKPPGPSLIDTVKATLWDSPPTITQELVQVCNNRMIQALWPEDTGSIYRALHRLLGPYGLIAVALITCFTSYTTLRHQLRRWAAQAPHMRPTWRPTQLLLYAIRIILYPWLTTMQQLSAWPGGAVTQPEEWFNTWLQSTFRVAYKPVFKTRLITHKFKTPKESTPNNHPHPLAANERNWASDEIDHMIRDAKMEVYSHSMSRTEANRNQKGTRLFFVPNDLIMNARNDPLTALSVIKMVDVDYYVPMNELLATGRPIIMYTFDPTSVCGERQSEYSYTSVQGHKVRLNVNPGATYEHQLWDYNVDSCSSSAGMFQRVYTYSVSRVRIPDSPHSFVALEPMWSLPWYIAYVAPLAAGLHRRAFSQGDYAVHRYQGPDKQMISIGRLGATQCCNLPASLMESILENVRAGPKTFTAAHVSTLLRSLKHDTAFIAHFSNLIYLYALEDRQLPLERSIGRDITNYWPVANSPLLNQTGAIGRSFHAPLGQPGGVCAKTPEASEDGIAKRMEQFQPALADPPEYEPYFLEFAGHLAESLEPWTIAQVEEVQNRAEQRRANKANETVATLGKATFQTFGKSEHTATLASQRQITSVAPDHRLEYSRFTHPLAALLKTKPWYAFGKQPHEVSQRVHELAQQDDDLRGTDYGKFDGRHSKGMCEMEVRLITQCYPDQAEYVEELMRKEIQAVGTSKYGQVVRHQYSRITGSPATSISNTLCNAFINYAAARLTGDSADEAMANMGLFGGDDGIIYGRYAAAAETVAKSFGADLKIEPAARWVPFLGRVYINPSTTPASIYDLRRFVTRSHLTAAPLDIPLSEAAKNKVAGYKVTDPQTPLIREWCAYMERTYGAATDIHVQNFNALAVKACKVPIPQVPHDDPLVWDVCLELVPEIMDLIQRLNEDLRVAPLVPAPEVKTDMVYDGHLHQLTKPDNSQHFDPAVQSSYTPRSPAYTPPPLRK
jgi:hypothetical protein